MSAVWFILVVGLLNTCLGFAIAVHLGRRYRTVAVAGAGSDWDFEDDFALPAKQEAGAISEAVAETDSSPEPTTTEQAAEPSPEPANPADEGPAPTAVAELDSSADPARDEPDGKPEDDVGATPDTATDDPIGRENQSDGQADSERLDDGAGPSEPSLGRHAGDGETWQSADPLPRISDAAPPFVTTDRPAGRVNDSETQRSESTKAGGASTEASDTLSPPPPDSAEADGLGPTAGRLAEVEAAPEAVEPPETVKPPGPGGAVPNGGPPQNAGPSSSEEIVEAFLAEVEQYQGQLDQVDAQLRSQAEHPDGDSIRACLESLLEAGREYSQQREQATAQLDSIGDEKVEFGLASGALQEAVRRQEQQIESTERAVAAFPYIDHLAQGCRVMIDETARLADANLLVRDTLHEVGAVAARGEHRLADLKPGQWVDAMTGADTRVALERALVEWMDGANRIETLAVAALDADEFSQVNRRFGRAAGNQLLQAIGKLLLSEKRANVRLARFRGERFVLLFPDADLREATNAVERLRQIVELARFDCRWGEIQVTVSCGVAEVASDDTPASILGRAEATLMEAKRYGRNRTFIHEGKYPTPVVPPKFTIEARRMIL